METQNEAYTIINRIANNFQANTSEITAMLENHSYQIIKHIVTKQYECINITNDARSLRECLKGFEHIQDTYANGISSIANSEKTTQTKCIESALFQYGKHKNESMLTKDATECFTSFQNNLNSKIKVFSSDYVSKLK